MARKITGGQRSGEGFYKYLRASPACPFQFRVPTTLSYADVRNRLSTRLVAAVRVSTPSFS